MKPDGVRRSVRSSSRERAAGDAPSMGRVARMPGTGLPKGKRKKRKVKDSARRFKTKRNRRKVIATWTLVIAGVAAVCLGVAVWLGIKFGTDRETPALALTAPPANIQREMPPAPRIPSLPEEAALALIKKALAIRDPALLPAYFRPSVLPPASQIEFLQKIEVADGRIDHFEWLGSLDANGLTIDGVLVAFQSDGLPRNRLAELVPDPDGKWKIDFDAFARTVTPSWADFIVGSAATAKVRVYVAPDSYYNGPFREESEWLCVGFSSPDSEQIFTGYCRRKSPQAAAMKWLLSKDAGLNRAVLEIRRTESAESRQVEITRVIAEDWVIGDKPFDERFK